MNLEQEINQHLTRRQLFGLSAKGIGLAALSSLLKLDGFAADDPSGKDPHTAGAKLDAGKALPWLCISGFAHALTAVADVTTKGAVKYTPNGGTVEFDVSLYNGQLRCRVRDTGCGIPMDEQGKIFGVHYRRT